jgi:hydrophobic/amphiphilic exporter-1 (mainly G- bacteria), HAE1 family
MVSKAASQSALESVFTTFRAMTPQFYLPIDRNKAETLGVSVGQVFTALRNYLGPSYVTQFNKFGQVFQVYVQAKAKFRLKPEDITNLKINNQSGAMVLYGT